MVDNIEEREWVREVQNTLAFILHVAFKQVAGKKVFVEHSYSDGFWCHCDINKEFATYENSEEELEKVKARMKELIEDESLELKETTIDFAVIKKKFASEGDLDRTEILRKWKCDPVPIISIDGEYDYTVGERHCTNRKSLQPFDLKKLRLEEDGDGKDVGFVLRCPSRRGSTELPPFIPDKTFFKFLWQRDQWRSVARLNTVRDLNEHVRCKEIGRTIWILESLHEKHFSKLAEDICKGFPDKRVILIAGPSSAGKTTFAKRLDIHLGVNGYSSVCFGLDDFYKEVPEEESATTNFESIDAFEIKELVSQIRRLVNGEEISPRRYNFKTRRAEFDENAKVRLQLNQFIMIEGIQSLNPLVSEMIGKDLVQRIFINTGSYISIDSSHRISSSDVRLVRRIVRDYQFRKYEVSDTLSRWHQVRTNEEEAIFPYQKHADFSFNTSLLFEFSILSSIATGLLAKYILLDGAGLGEDDATVSLAKRLFTILSFFESTDDRFVPGTSILKEFFGGSLFSY